MDIAKQIESSFKWFDADGKPITLEQVWKLPVGTHYKVKGPDGIEKDCVVTQALIK